MNVNTYSNTYILTWDNNSCKMHKKVSKIRNKALPSNLVRYFLQVISFAPDGECELRDINLLFILTYIRCCNGMVIDNLSFNSEPRNFINFALLMTKQHSKYTAIMAQNMFCNAIITYRTPFEYSGQTPFI